MRLEHRVVRCRFRPQSRSARSSRPKASRISTFLLALPLGSHHRPSVLQAVLPRGHEVKIWSGHLGGAKTTREIVDGLMRWPYLPMGIEALSSHISYGDFRAGDVLEPRDGIVNPHRPPQPSRAERWGIASAYDGRSSPISPILSHEPGELDTGTSGPRRAMPIW